MESSKLSFSRFPFLSNLNLTESNLGCFNGKTWTGTEEGVYSVNPTSNEKIAYTSFTKLEEYEETIKNMNELKDKWMNYPMVKRGDIVKEIGDLIKLKKHDLGRLIALEVGKIEREGVGEVQEVIDICDYAQGLSRTLPGKIYQSERKEHILLENWNPLGTVGVITAFNFPFAVLGWNAAIALVCGNLVMWKGSETTSLVHVAVTRLIDSVLTKYGFSGVFTLVSGRGDKIGEKMINDKRITLISFTGSTPVGRHVSKAVHSRFGRTILELGGNNTVIVMEDADLSNALPQIVFGSVGTCGQRCTTIRRLMVHEKVYDTLIHRLVESYKAVSIGDPLVEGIFCGPLHTKRALDEFTKAIETAKKQGGKVLYGGKLVNNKLGGNFVYPTIIEIDLNAPIVQEEVFAPILYVNKIKSFEEGVKINNQVSQGLSSSIFTQRMDLVFKWMGPLGSDCGLVNVNVGTSGAEIGGAFGGEKETGGGRESGGESWRQYMRQSTSCVNFGKEVQLAQGIVFPKF